MTLTMTIDTARSSLGLGKTKLYELINEGKVQTIKVGRRRLVTFASMQAFVEAQMTVQPSTIPN